MATKQCPKCKEEIQDNAKKCKHCGSDLRNWFIRHKFLTAILVLLILGFIGSLGKDSSTGNKAPNSPVNVAEDNHKVTKENCDLIKANMTGDQVKNILGEPKSTSESEMAGIGKFEYWHFQEGFSMQACSVILSNGKVSSKTWTDL